MSAESIFGNSLSTGSPGIKNSMLSMLNFCSLTSLSLPLDVDPKIYEIINVHEYNLFKI
jgi:hypothetical protein